MQKMPVIAALGLITTSVVVAASAAPSGSAAAAADRGPAVVRVGTTAIADPVPAELIGANHRWPNSGLGMWDAGRDEPSPDMVDLSRRLGLNLVRYPGGTVANLFRWKRAIGPQEERSCQTGGGFVGNQEPMDSVYGVEEHMRFTESIGAQTHIMTSSVQPVQDAADFVEYTNAPLGTNPGGGVAWAEVRAANGHSEPYDVSVWEIGNELYLGNQVYWRAQDLSTRVQQYAFGGTEHKSGEPVGKDCDNRDSASLSDGSAAQSFKVRWQPAVPDSQTIYVDGTAWQEVSDLSAAGPDDQVYEFDPATGAIQFGDGAHGQVPDDGLQITADYESGPHPGFVDYYAAMKAVDPSISICTAWEKPEWVELMGTEHPYDCIAPHLYSRPDVRGEVEEIHDRWMGDADNVLDELRHLESALDATFGADADQPFLAASEWGAIPAPNTGPPPDGWANSVSWSLYAADLLGGMVEHDVKLADISNLNLGVPTFGELFGGAPDFHWQARANVIQLFSRLIGSSPVDTELDNSPRASTGDFDALTAYATRADDGTVRVVVVNRDRDRAIPARLVVPGVRGRADVRVLTHNGPNIDSYNTPDDENVVATRESSLVWPAPVFWHSFEAHSVTLLEIES